MMMIVAGEPDGLGYLRCRLAHAPVVDVLNAP